MIGNQNYQATPLRNIYLSLAKTQYENDARVIANKGMFPGVSMKLNKQTYKASKETLKSRIVYIDGDRQYQPIIDR